MKKYIPSVIEPKWQKKWTEDKLYITKQDSNKPKKYILDMFPYPSAATMHVGHLEGYVGTDIISRYERMKGNGVLHPMGWDSFGLPAENYAIKTGIHPNESTHKNIETFKRQLNITGLSYDWNREIDTSSSQFYKWTQWLFILMFKQGLAYKKEADVNWCPSCQTVLANEQVVEGACDRCSDRVMQKQLDQWFLKITDYADRLISGLDHIDWLEEVKVQQKNWIGRSEGMKLKFDDIEVFTTRPDTVHGATFIALASDNKDGKETKEKWGEFTGKYVTNPATGKKIPVWEVNYVTKDYGTGAIMGVPAHDERDFEFAKKYGLEILKMKSEDKWWKEAEKRGWGQKEVRYHLRDWLISRQRYWGTPIPMIYCQKCAWQPVPEKDLPVELPTDVDFRPTGKSPIARSKSFQENVVCPNCNGKAKREVDTMDTYVDSSWYFIRFVDSSNIKEFASQKAIRDWLPVEVYVGGGHVVQHLLFARFFWKVLFDAGLIDKSLGDEPFLKLRAPGWILGPDSRKMSKRWGNVVTPDDVIPQYGADAMRLYEMFMGPFEVMKPSNLTGVEGVYRFLQRIWGLQDKVTGDRVQVADDLRIMHKTIKKVGDDIEAIKFNTAVASLMEWLNHLLRKEKVSKEEYKTFLLLLAPFAPHMTEELFQLFSHPERPKEVEESIHQQSWPEFDNKYLEEEEISIPVQINGKVRDILLIAKDTVGNRKVVEKEALSNIKVQKFLEGKSVKKIVYVPGKIINIVI